MNIQVLIILMAKKRITTSNFATGLEYIKLASLKHLQVEKINFKK